METRSGWLLQASPRNGCNRSIPLTGMETAIFPSATMLTLILLQPINTPHGDGNNSLGSNDELQVRDGLRCNRSIPLTGMETVKTSSLSALGEAAMGCNRSIPLTGMETPAPSSGMSTARGLVLQPVNTPHGDAVAL